MDPSKTFEKRSLSHMEHIALKHCNVIPEDRTATRASRAAANASSQPSSGQATDTPTNNIPATPAESKWAASATGASAVAGNQGASATDVFIIITSLRDNPNDQIMFSKEQIIHIRRDEFSQLGYVTAPVTVGYKTYTTKLYLNINTGKVYIHKNKVLAYAVGKIEELSPTAGQQYKEALAVLHERMEVVTAEFAVPFEEDAQDE